MPLRGRWRPTLRRRVQGLVAVLVVLLVAIAVVAVGTGLRAGQANQEVSDRLLPALEGVGDLQKTYRDQLTAQREYVLSGQPSFLEPYEAAPAAVDAVQTRLRRLLGGEPAMIAALDSAQQAYDEWLERASRPVIALVGQGDVAQAREIIAPGGLNTSLYTVIRERVDALRRMVQGQVTTATARVAEVQRQVLWAIGIALVIGLFIGALALVDLRRSVTRPIADLVTGVAAVAGGAVDRPVPATGPAEIANIARAVERMRLQLADHTRKAVAAEHQMARSQESERIATELRDQVIGRLFATGSSLISLANRHAEVNPPLLAAVRQLDEIGRRLRQVIFDLNLAAEDGQRSVRQQLLDLVEEVERDLGFTPAIGIDGPVDTIRNGKLVTQVIAAAREALSAISLEDHPHQAAIRLTLADSTLHLVTEHETQPDVADHNERWTTIAARATNLGGTCTVRHNDDGRTVLDWAVPTTV